MTTRVLSQLVNGFVAVMLLSACTGAGQDHKQSVTVAAKPVVKAIPLEEPVLPRLKPKTPKKAPASPKLSELEPADATTTDSSAAPADGSTAIVVPDGHRQAITPANPASDVTAKDADDVAMPGEVAAVPTAPDVIKAEPEPVGIATPDELKSKAENDIVRILGLPVSTRSEGTGTVWTYRTDTCSLDVYFFLDVADNQRRALSYEMMPPGAEDDATQSCYKALKTAHHVQ
jgi:antitoxin (DNA-binding transcriptional repressor) of toxin-antitoxin stability system